MYMYMYTYLYPKKKPIGEPHKPPEAGLTVKTFNDEYVKFLELA